MEYETLIQELPETEQFLKILKRIEMLKQDAEQETDPILIKDSFDTAFRLQDQLFADALTFYTNKHSEQFEKLNAIIEKQNSNNILLKSKLESEMKVYQDMFDSMCLLLLERPRETFQDIILKQVERKAKTESTDGYDNWQWGFHFPLIARLRMAWKLIFGTKEVSANG